MASDGSKVTVSTDLASWVTGTANQITVTDDGDGTITLSAPQDLGSGSSPTFVGLTLSGLTASRMVVSNGSKALVSDDIVNWIAGTANQITVTDDADGSVTLSTPQDIHSGASPTFVTVDLTGITDNNIPYMGGSGFADSPLSTDGTDLISTGVVQATNFAKTGWPFSPGVTLSFDNGTRTFTVTDGGSAYYYIAGVKYTLGGNKTVQITDTEGEWYIYFSGSTLTASQTPWVITDDDKAFVAALYWDATNNEHILLGYELHGFQMDAATHSRLHHGGGSAWDSGLLVSDAGSEDINVSAGDFHDEDIEVTITDSAGGGLWEQVLSPAELPIYYRSGASDWRRYDTADKATATDAGYVDGSNDLHYNKLNGTWASTAMTTGKYVAYYVVATNDQSTPVALIMGQRIDNTLAQARANNVFSGMSLSGLPFTEMVLLARLLLVDTGSGVYYTLEEITDLRSTNAQGTVTTPLITDHGGLGGLSDDDHTQYALLAGRTGGQTLSGSDTTSEDLTLEDNSVDNNTITVTQMRTAHTHVTSNGSDHSYISQDVTTTGNPQFATIELGHASDTTLTRVSAGVVAIEGTNIAMVGGAHHDGFSDFVANEHIPHTSQFEVTKDDAQTLTASSWNLIEFDDEVEDPDGVYDAATNYRFTAPVAGRYQFNASVGVDDTNAADGDQVIMAFYKNGTLHRRGQRIHLSLGGSSSVASSCKMLLAQNDYVDVRVNPILAGGNGATTAVAADNYFDGCRIG
jgi:hypothetical protein